MYYVGIDPGARGGIAILDHGGSAKKTFKMPVNKEGVPQGYAICNLIHHQLDDDAIMFIEKVHAMSKWGVTSTFTFGRNYGIVLGIASKMADDGILEEVNLVDPKAWHTVMTKQFAGMAKQRAMLAAKELWPFEEGVMKNHDGIVDALLIAEYGRRVCERL